MSDPKIKRKLNMFLVGVLFFIVLYTSNYLGNGNLIPNTMFTLISVLIIPGGIFIYLGVLAKLQQ